MDLGLSGKTALVTASSKGIGKAIAQGLAAEGCQVIICGRDKDNLLKAAQNIEAKTGQLITPILVDLEQKDSISQLLKDITNQFSTIDILVNNAGGMPYKYHYELKQEDWQQSFDLTFMSQVWMKNVPLRRPATTEEVANLAVFLASEKASYITRTCIQVDGGFVKSLF